MKNCSYNRHLIWTNRIQPLVRLSVVSFYSLFLCVSAITTKGKHLSSSFFSLALVYHEISFRLYCPRLPVHDQQLTRNVSFFWSLVLLWMTLMTGLHFQSLKAGCRSGECDTLSRLTDTFFFRPMALGATPDSGPDGTGHTSHAAAAPTPPTFFQFLPPSRL